MSKIQKASKVWTGAVAYVSLLVGAGLSIAGNLADTVRLRSDALDQVDIALAIGAPLASLLVAEMFVSKWPANWSVQSIRWVATVVVGALAMIVSWSHIHALLLARGQEHIVAILWPLAIDGLAIMAMAKILVTRGHVANVAIQEVATGQTETVATVLANGHDELPVVPITYFGHKTPPPWVAELASLQSDGHTDPVATRPLSEPLPEDYAATLAKDVDNWNAGQAPAAMAKPRPVPAEPRELLEAWDGVSLSAKEVDELLAAYFGKSLGTTRKWRREVARGPVSGQPSSPDVY